MLNPEAYIFDPGFAHAYPKFRGLVERFQEESGSRTITEVVPETGDVFPKLIEGGYPTFDYEEYSGVRIHHIPSDARDLVELIRLGRDSRRVYALGVLLGRSLGDLLETVHSFPIDTVLPRFAGHISNKKDSSIGGVELKLLPPFDRFTQPETTPDTEGLLEIIETDLLEISYLPDQKVEDFLEGYQSGLNA